MLTKIIREIILNNTFYNLFRQYLQAIIRDIISNNTFREIIPSNT